MLSPGYSYDTAYVEFLNLEDAVHFMESNKVAHPRHSTKAVSLDYEGLRRLLVDVGGVQELGKGCSYLSEITTKKRKICRYQYYKYIQS